MSPIPADLIRWANQSEAPILSLDVPSGLDAATGQGYDPHIEAAATLTLALPKTGVVAEMAASSVGELYLADISVPPQLYAELNLVVDPIFAQEQVLQLSA